MAGGGDGTVRDVKSKEQLDGVVSSGSAVILHFWASWCDASKQMDQVFSHLSTDFPHAHFLRVEAEEQPGVSETFSVSAVPYFVFFKDGKVVDTLEGANPSSLANKVAKVAGSLSHVDFAAPASLGMAAGPTVLETIKDMATENLPVAVEKPSSGLGDPLKQRLEKLVDSHPVFLFMKGTPDEPRCGFSKKVVNILKAEGIRFGSFDILTDDEVREGMKTFSNWPTFPQLFCKGELLGGCDIATAMHESGELKQVFRENGIKPEGTEVDSGENVESRNSVGVSDSTGLSDVFTSRLQGIINSSPVMLFMKGTPVQPRCKFSGKVVEILKQENVEFGSFDILSDEEVRQGLKIFSNWSSYPQLYIKGELIGGADIVLEMQKSGELKKTLREKGVVSFENHLKNLIASSDTMLFMKGTPDAPCCGFSSKVVNALRQDGITFGSFNILEDQEVRQGLKEFSNWPTYPQLYYKGELIGGCDIIMEMHRSGDLKATLSE